MSDYAKQLKEVLDKAIEGARRSKLEEDRKQLLSSLVGQDLSKILSPVLSEIVSKVKLNKEDLREIMQELMGQVASIEYIKKGVDTKSITDAIERAFGNIYIPEPKVVVQSPKLEISEIVSKIKLPEEMGIRGWVQLQGVDLNNPLPVQLRDAKGNPVKLFENLTSILGGGGGATHKIVKISGIENSAYGQLINPDNRLKVELPSGGGGLTDGELRASAVPVSQVSGATWSTESAQQGAWRVDQVSGSVSSVVVNDVLVTVGVNQLSGANWSVFANNPVDNGDAATALRVVMAGNSSASVAASQVGTWNVTVNGATATVATVGDKASDVTDDEANPFKIGGIARVVNPTAVDSGDRVSASFDDLGRLVTRPVHVRDLIKTAYASISTGTEATLLAGVAGVFFDLIYAMATNSSDAAVTVDLRSATAAGIVSSIRVPANGTAGVSLSVPLPQDVAADTWTVDIPDITGTTVTISALFSREV